MKVLVVGGVKLQKKGEVVVFTSATGNVKFSVDLATKLGIAAGDYVLASKVEFEGELGLTGNHFVFHKCSEETLKACKVGGKNGNFVQISNAEAWSICRGAEFSGQEVTNGDNGTQKQNVSFKVEIQSYDLGAGEVTFARITEPTITNVKPRGEGSEDEEEDDEPTIELPETEETVISETVESVTEEEGVTEI